VTPAGARRWAAALGLTLALAALGGGCLQFHQGPMPGEPAGARFAAVAGARVRYTDQGQGPAVVLIHGFASSLETWTGVAPALRGRHRVIAVDLKGFGWTDRPPGDYSPAGQARLVRALLDRLGIETFAAVGHSYGASVALELALQTPARVTRLALYDAWVYEEQLPSLFLWARARGLGEALFALFYEERPEEKLALAFYDPSRIPQQLIDDVERAFARPGTRAAALAAVRGMRYAAVEGRYRTVTQPTLLLWGREDVVSPVAVGERLSRELPRSRLVVYPRCGHLPMLEAAAASTAELAAFLDAAAPAAAPAEGR